MQQQQSSNVQFVALWLLDAASWPSVQLLKPPNPVEHEIFLVAVLGPLSLRWVRQLRASEAVQVLGAQPRQQQRQARVLTALEVLQSLALGQKVRPETHFVTESLHGFLVRHCPVEMQQAFEPTP